MLGKSLQHIHLMVESSCGGWRRDRFQRVLADESGYRSPYDD
jgi:hypothetical protein